MTTKDELLHAEYEYLNLKNEAPRLHALLTTPTVFDQRDRPTRMQSGVEVPITYSGTY